MIDRSAVNKLSADILKRDMLTSKDPKDMAFILPELDGAHLSIHNFIFRAALFRMYSKQSTYLALCKHVGAPQPNKKDPDWKSMEKALASLYAGPEPVWGGMFYPATLKAAIGANRRFKWFRNVKTPALKADRDIQAFKAIWAALQKNDKLATYYKRRQSLSHDSASQLVVVARDAFGDWYDSFYEHMTTNTKGWFGDYAMKCILDVGCNATLYGIKDSRQVFPDAVLSRWPVNCPAYTQGIKKLLKSSYKNAVIRQSLKYKLLMHVHCTLSKKLGAATHRVPSTLAQLCWQKRQAREKTKTR